MLCTAIATRKLQRHCGKHYSPKHLMLFGKAGAFSALITPVYLAGYFLFLGRNKTCVRREGLSVCPQNFTIPLQRVTVGHAGDEIGDDALGANRFDAVKIIGR